MALLEIEGLEVRYTGRDAAIEAVRGVSLEVGAGECVGVVGESGAGKSQLFLASLRLVPRQARLSGRVIFDGEELLRADMARLNRIRGTRLAMVFQDPSGALTPHLTIGTQLAEVLVTHQGASWRAGRAQALEALERVQIGNPGARLDQYPHELSGGMRQRVLIAMALLGGPKLLIADEPTSALDATVQAQILALFESLRAAAPLALVLISHDLAVVARLAERIIVMYAGRIVESAPASQLLREPRHPYSAALLACVPRLQGARPSRMPCLAGAPARAEESQAGCAFAARCSRAMQRCTEERPLLKPEGAGAVACHYPLER